MVNKKSTPPAPASQETQLAGAHPPSIQIITQYVKDMSFENPHAPESLVSGWPSPETSIQISLAQKTIKDNTYESSLQLRVEAKNKKDGRMSFIIDLHYGALVTLVNIPKENIAAVLMVEVPKLLFPFVREQIAGLSTNGGYPPLYLSPISFEAIYMNELQRLQDAKNKQTGQA